MECVVRDKKYPGRFFWVRDNIEGHYVQFKDSLAKVSPADAIELLKNDDFELLSDYTCPYNPKNWTKDYRKLYWESNADSFSGFGSVSMNAVKSLGNLGVDVCFGGQQFDKKSFPDEEFSNYKKNIDPDCVVIQYRQPGQYRRNMAERMFGYTPWETSQVPLSWVGQMNKMYGIFTTCKQNVECFKNSGVKVPIYIYYHGVDPLKYPYIERSKNSTFVFGSLGRLSIRKGTDILIKAFKEEFKTEKDVALMLKTSDAMLNLGKIDDSRIIVIGEVCSHEKKLEYLSQMDCFVFPSRGEGFGLPPLEAMATGIPCIMTNWSGLADFGDKDDTLLLDYKLEPALNFTKDIYKEECGLWAEPDFAQLKQKMRWAYEHRDKIKTMGKQASERVHFNWNWTKSTTDFINTLDKILC
jgi:glycosyltransferase involved in cell wall biosynthesis